MKLKEFLTNNNLTVGRFSQISGVKPNVVVNGVYGRGVGLVSALKIEKATYGAVKPVDLLNDEIKQREGLA